MTERNAPDPQMGQTSRDTLMQNDAGFGQTRADGGYASGSSAQSQQTLGESSGLAEQIREHMAVIDADGEQVGTVDSVENGQIKLTRQDSADGEHHYLPVDNVAGIENGAVRRLVVVELVLLQKAHDRFHVPGW